MITKGISIAQLRLDQPVVHLWRSDDRWAITRIVKRERREADRSGPGRPIAFEEIGISERNGRDRRSRCGAADARAVAVRTARRQRGVSLRAGSLLGGHHPRVVSRVEPRPRAQLSVGRRRGAQRHAVLGPCRRAHGRELAHRRRRDRALPVHAGLPAESRVGEAVDAGARGRVAGARGAAADARVYARARRPAQPPQGRALRAFVGG